jgi:replicative DNA helicase
MIFSLEIEQQFLATLLQNPNEYYKVAGWITHKDFYNEKSKVNETIFSVIRSILDKNESLDSLVVIERVRDLGISFEENISIADYIYGLGMRKTSGKNLVSLAKELKKITVRRDIFLAARETAMEMQKISNDATYNKIIEKADESFNKKIDLFEGGSNAPINLAKEMKEIVENRGNNPIKSFGPVGPHKKLFDMYGSLLRCGNITVIVARSGIGKTTFCLDYSTKVALEDDIPILHLDNGEMSKEELSMRQTAALSGVPLYLLESGNWRRHGQETVDKVREVWDIVKDLKLFYYNVGGMSTEAIISLVKRFYYSRVGRGNKMTLSFDYIKPPSHLGYSKQEWQAVGDMINNFKNCIQNEVTVDDEPMISMITSVQSNRAGITTNKNSDSIIDDESIVAMSDRITSYCSHLFILRKKTIDEIIDEGDMFGTHKLSNVKPRHLGRDVAGALNIIDFKGKKRRNFINLEIDNFSIEECGDLRDIVDFHEINDDLEPTSKLQEEEKKEDVVENTDYGLPDFNAV